MKIQGREILIQPFDSGLALKRGDIIVYAIISTPYHLTRQDTWSDGDLLMCDCYAACELDEVLRRNKDAD